MKNLDLLDLDEAFGNDPGLVTADGFDDCVVGIVESCGAPNRICYDREKIVRTLMKRDKMSHEDEDQFCSFNITGAYVGKNTPVFLTRTAPVKK